MQNSGNGKTIHIVKLWEGAAETPIFDRALAHFGQGGGFPGQLVQTFTGL